MRTSPEVQTERSDPETPESPLIRYQRELGRYLRFLGCPADQVDDYLQDTLLAALENGVCQFAPPAARAWLRTTARNLFWMDKRREARWPRRVTADIARLDALWQEDGKQSGSLVHRLRAVLPILDARERRVLEMRYWQGLSRSSMARELQMTAFGVKSLLRRIRRRLHDAVERQEPPHDHPTTEA